MSARAKWASADVRITSKIGVTTVPGFVHPDAPGLAVTPSEIDDDQYRVTHLRSGCAMMRTLSQYPLAHAKQLAIVLATAIDCTLSAEEMANVETVIRVREALLPALTNLGYSVVLRSTPCQNARDMRRAAAISSRVLAEDGAA